jgi:hypothetical protein
MMKFKRVLLKDLWGLRNSLAQLHRIAKNIEYCVQPLLHYFTTNTTGFIYGGFEYVKK